MKKALLLSLAMTSLVACMKENEVTPGNPTDTTGNAIDSVLRDGTFMNGVHVVSGSVSILKQDGHLILKLEENFSSENGPDLKVYLSTDLAANHYIRLGALQTTSGKQTYSIPAQAMPDFDEHKYVLIWCEAYSVLFGSAEL